MEGPLRAACEALSLALSDDEIHRLLSYLDLLVRWNGTYNLTAVREPRAMLTQHVVDCLAVVPALRRERGTGPLRVLDVGSGGGLPGVVLAVLHPQWRVECVDTVGKKAAFVRQVAVELGLPNLVGTHARVEQTLEVHDLIVCRAFASLPLFVSLTRKLLRPDGVWAGMKGKVPQEELAELRLREDVSVFHVEHIDVPGLDAERCLIWMRPVA